MFKEKTILEEMQEHWEDAAEFERAYVKVCEYLGIKSGTRNVTERLTLRHRLMVAMEKARDSECTLETAAKQVCEEDYIKTLFGEIQKMARGSKHGIALYMNNEKHCHSLIIWSHENQQVYSTTAADGLLVDLLQDCQKWMKKHIATIKE